MNNLKKANRLVASLVVLIILAAPLLAQERRNAARKPAVAAEPAPTFDSLLADESYKVYCEIRGVGGLVRSSAVNDLLDPVMKLGGPPKEFKTLVKWLNAHANVLAGSRMLVAGWPSRPALPNVLVAIEFSSPEEAKKFYPELSDFLPKLFPTPTPTPSPVPASAVEAPAAPKVITSGPPVVRAELRTDPRAVEMTAPVSEKNSEPDGPPYQMKQAGSLVFISDTAFTFRSLRPRGSKALEENQNFLVTRNRFASESLFLYVDLKSIEKEEKERQQKWEEEAQKQADAEAANPPRAELSIGSTEEEMNAAGEEMPLPSPETTSEEPVVAEATIEPPTSDNATLSAEPQRGTDEVSPLIFSLYGTLFGGESKWPEAIGAGLVFEGDAYVVRTLIINSIENKNAAIPFFPRFVSGPALTPESPGIFPADIDLFVAVSLDYPEIYEGMLKAMAAEQERVAKYSGQPAAYRPAPESSFAAYEKKLGINIKDDLLPLLGNELALALPKPATKTTSETPAGPQDENPKSGVNEPKPEFGPNPVIAISIKDREAVRRLIPKIIEGFGLKGANLLAQTERHDGTEIVSYAGAFAYAFVGDFLVLSPDPAATRHVVDAYLNHQTLSSDSHFRNYTRWHPRQVQGQVYTAPGLVEQAAFGTSGSPVAGRLSEFLAGVNPVIDPLTYSLTNDGLGPFHELHVPKTLLLFLVAGMSVGASEALPASNEAATKSMMRTVVSAEETFKATTGNDGYGSIDQLASAGLISKEMLDKYGYRIEVSVAKDKFEIAAVPIEYGRTGKLSFFIDQSGVLRGADHGGGAATVSDRPLD